ncbi:hypothetical protein, partial [Methylobacterium longum]
FPRTGIRDRASGVRIAYVADYWCIERLRSGDITDRRPMPSEADARRIAARISRRDKVPLLPTYQHRRPWRTAKDYTPDDAA